MNHYFRYLALAPVLAIAVAVSAADELDSEKLRGMWNCVSAVIDGRTLSEETVKELKLTMTSDKYKTERGAQVLFDSVHKLDLTKTPREIEMIGTEGDLKGKAALGIYALEGDMLRICYSIPGKPRPTAFESKTGSGIFLVTWKRAAAPNDAAVQEFKRMDGTWKCLALDYDGNKLSAAQLEAVRLVQTGDKYASKVGDTIIDGGTLMIDPTKKPKTIDAMATTGSAKGRTLLGIYEFDGDDYKICFGDTGNPRPTEFAAGAGSGNILIVYKREKS